MAWVSQYVDEVRRALAMPPDDGTLFLTRGGVPLNACWLSTTVSRYVQRANLGKHWRPSLFRHTLATLMLENGADIRFIQAMLG
jgi:integrase/recombinase XerD